MRYGFGEVTLDTDTYELRTGGRLVDVEPQVFDVLAYLVANRDRVVPKGELLDAVWGDRFVSESALTTRIKQARQAVGDDGQAQRVVRTLHGRGYRFVAPLDGAGPAAPEPAATAPPRARHEGDGDDGQDGHLGQHHHLGFDEGIDPIPATHYVTNDGAAIAYQVFGEGPDLVLIEGFTTNVEVQWEHPAIARFLRRLGSFCRVTVLDKRGTGLSDRIGPAEAPPLEQRAEDVRAVMDTVGIERATVFGSSEGGSLSVLLTAAHPERVDRLVLHGTWARHPWYDEPERPEIAAVERRWGTGWTIGALAESLAGTAAARRFLGRFERQAATPGTARRLAEMMRTIDVTPLLPSIRVPTLVVHRSDDVMCGMEHAHDLVRGIPDARLVELPGRDHFLFSGDTGPILAAVEDFVVGTSSTSPGAGPASPDRFLTTVLVADIVGSIATAADVGDARFSRVLDDFAATARRCVEAHRGRLVGFSGDGLVATFDGPGRGVRAACSLRAALAPLGTEIRAGVHTAEVERRGADIAGVGVNVASRLAAAAEPGAIWVSRVVTDLVAGCGLVFVPRGEHELAGLPERWSAYEVAA
jgi:pimeloyl-ACP methyl ester carboxylesterase/class 3 adenylate cyclase/DNA-binding winged helix-turn-helix (wHTH) protein